MGAWAWNGGDPRFIFEANGSVTTASQRHGRWSCVSGDAGQRRYEIHWIGEDIIAYYTLSADGLEMTGTNNKGTKLRVTRLGPPPPDSPVGTVRADEKGFRSWTIVKSGQKFEGRIITKKTDNSQVQISRRDGKAAWIRTETLCPADQFYVKYWVDPQAQVSARLTAHGNPGWKRVKVTIQAGPEPLLVTVSGQVPPPHPQIAGLPRPPFKRIVATGERVEFEFASGTRYGVEASANGRLLDQESEDRKTGL